MNRFFTNKYSEKRDGVVVQRVKAGSPLCFAQAILFMPSPVMCVRNAPIKIEAKKADTMTRRISSAALAVVLHVSITRYIAMHSLTHPL